jgi:hypothetical protein
MDNINVQNMKKTMISMTSMISMTVNQEINIDCTPNANDKFEAEYYSHIYSRPKTVVANCFKNILEFYDENDTSISFRYYSSQAWDTFDRKLRGFEFNIPYAYDDDVIQYENRDSLYINFSVRKEEKTLVIHTYYRNRDVYRESVNSTYGSFSNWKSKVVIDNESFTNNDYSDEYIRHSLFYLFKKMEEDKNEFFGCIYSVSNIFDENVNIELKLDEEMSAENKSNLYI